METSKAIGRLISLADGYLKRLDAVRNAEQLAANYAHHVVEQIHGVKYADSIHTEMATAIKGRAVLLDFRNEIAGMLPSEHSENVHRLLNAIDDKAKFEAIWDTFKPALQGLCSQLANGVQLKKVPAKFRTVPMTLKRAAKLIGKTGGKDAATWLKRSIEDGTFLCDSIGRQSHIFDLRDFPESARATITPPMGQKLRN